MRSARKKSGHDITFTVLPALFGNDPGRSRASGAELKVFDVDPVARHAELSKLLREVVGQTPGSTARSTGPMATAHAMFDPSVRLGIIARLDIMPYLRIDDDAVCGQHVAPTA